MMKKWFLGGLAALGLAALFAPTPSYAASQYLCAPEVSGAAAGPRNVVNTSSTATPQPQYSLNGQGCAQINVADVGFFLSQGFTQGSPFQTIVFNTGVATGTTNFVIGTIPAQAYIQSIMFSNSVAAAVTGGISIGTTANGADVVAAQACASAGTPLNAAAVTAWNSANVTITVTYGFF
jgi:hypothetical protein